MNVKLLLEKQYWGLYNMVYGEKTSRIEVATELLSILNLAEDIKIREVSSAFFRNEYFTLRPSCERLINRRLELRGINIMCDWRVVLKEYLENYYRNYLDL